jgi:hypothetical protein
MYHTCWEFNILFAGNQLGCWLIGVSAVIMEVHEVESCKDLPVFCVVLYNKYLLSIEYTHNHEILNVL